MDSEKNYRETAKEKAKQLLMLLPNLVKMLYRMVGDNTVAFREKAILLGTVAYIISPLDFLPDAIPFLGQIDDLLLVALILKRFMNSIDRSLMYKYWDGEDTLLLTVEKILEYARILLPQGVYEKIVKKAREDTIDLDYEVK